MAYHRYQICKKNSNGSFEIIEVIRAGSPVNAETKFRTQRIKPPAWKYYVRYQDTTKRSFHIKY